jgi:hypothetical protein
VLQEITTQVSDASGHQEYCIAEVEPTDHAASVIEPPPTPKVRRQL